MAYHLTQRAIVIISHIAMVFRVDSKFPCNRKIQDFFFFTFQIPQVYKPSIQAFPKPLFLTRVMYGFFFLDFKYPSYYRYCTQTMYENLWPALYLDNSNHRQLSVVTLLYSKINNHFVPPGTMHHTSGTMHHIARLKSTDSIHESILTYKFYDHCCFDMQPAQLFWIIFH